MTQFRLISFPLCPYVQRAAIVLTEKGVPFERTDIDLADKPDWFLKLSPLGKVPVLIVTTEEGREEVLFESAVIAEYLDEVLAPRLHPADPLEKARHRAWIEFASAALADLAGYYSAADADAFRQKEAALRGKFERLEGEVRGAPFFAGAQPSLVDAAFAPVFRYLDLLDSLPVASLLERLPKLQAWREALRERPSVQGAAPADYVQRLAAFIRAKGSYLAGTIQTKELEAA
ncbi:MAG TPA: glutathione S-transferase family protein [Allosphingosinicella sp.]